MPSTTTVTVRVPADLEAKLARLAELTRRSRSYLAAQAILEFVERELDICESIEVAREEIRQGKGIPHEQVMAEIRALFDDMERRTDDAA